MAAIEPKFAFVLIATHDPQNVRMKRAQLATWVRDFKNIAPVYFVYGDGTLGEGESEVTNLHKIKHFEEICSTPVLDYKLQKKEENDFTFQSVAGWDQILPKTISAFKEVLTQDSYDFIIRTNLSSYWNLQNTLSLLNTLPRSGVYAGPTRNYNQLRYVEGDAIILSADVARKLISSKNLLDASVIDDLAIAYALKKLSIFPLHLKRPWIQMELTRLAFRFMCNSESNPIRVRTSLKKLLIDSHVIRCKDPHAKLGHVFRQDIILMLVLKCLFRYSKY